MLVRIENINAEGILKKHFGKIPSKFLKSYVDFCVTYTG